MAGQRVRRVVGLAVAVLVGLLGMPAGAAMAGVKPAVPPPMVGRAWHLPSAPVRSRNGKPVLGQGSGTAQSGVAAALREARAAGRAVSVASMTSATQSATVSPSGVVTARSYVLPVRVRRGAGWVPVSTRLRASGGRVVPAALPGDAVTFSAGGAGPMATISAGGRKLSLWWPGRLPAPAVSSSSATYHDVLPGVSLVLTATSAAAGGFREVLVVSSPAAAARLAGLSLRATGPRLRMAPGGGLTALAGAGQRAFTAAAPQMWDSSGLAPGARSAAAAVQRAAAAAKAVGAELAGTGVAAASSPAGPAGGARLARVAVSVPRSGRSLKLRPDAAMLTASSTRYPVYIDPDFTVTGSKQDYDPVQSGSGCTSSHWNSSIYTYSPVGYDNFEQGTCQYSDTDYALYRVAIPTQGSGSGSGTSVLGGTANLISASFQTSEVYTASCTNTPTLTVSWIGAINSSTGWPGPGKDSLNTDATTKVGPDPGSCNTTEDTGEHTAAGFNVLADMNAITSTATNITFRLWENGDTTSADHKQFTDNPDLKIVYIDTPNVPSSLEAAATGSGSGSAACDTSNPGTNPDAAGLPHLGKTDSADGPYVIGSFTTDDTNSVTGTVRYWNNATPSVTATVKTAPGAGTLDAQIPASFTAGLPNGTVIGYDADAYDSDSGTTYTSAWSPSCYVAIYPTAPDAPAVQAQFDQTVPQAVGSPLTFTITQSAGDTATEFVWGLDSEPPTSGTIPAAQTCAAGSATCPLAGGSATVTITVPSPGPHNFWVYELDTGGNESGMTNQAAPGSSATFRGAADPPVSYTAGASLAANFAAARSAGQSFDNTMIATQTGSSGTANGDGNNNSYDPGQLTSAGWGSGAGVTVDGATFALPSFGTSASGPDNVLAANQTLGTGSGGARASAVVFLVSATHGNVLVPGTVTGSPDAGLVAGDDTAPGVAGGTPVAGDGCTTSVVAFDQTQAGCVPASGTVSYAAGCAESQTSYQLTVPDWVSGPADLAAVISQDRDTSTGQTADSPKVYAFAVPVNPACTITSVTLPDVGDTVLAGGNTGGITKAEAAVHIFGVALRSTTHATPEVTGTAAAAPTGQAWTGAAESPIEDAFAPPSGVTWGNRTMRIAVTAAASAPAGAQLRIRLSDPGFLSADGDGPLQIGAASIAPGAGGAVPVQAPVPLTFGGAAAATVPEGGDVYSDPLTLPFAVTAGHELLVSVWLKNTTLPELPENSWASGAQTWWAPASVPNQTADATGAPFTGTSSVTAGVTAVLTGIDVTTPEVTSGGTEVSAGTPTAVVAGDNVIDGAGSHALSDAQNTPSQRLAGQLFSQGLASGFAVVDAGVAANRVLADGTTAGGVSLLARLDRDVLAEPDVGTVLLDEGLEDLLTSSGASPGQLENALAALTGELNAFGVTVIAGTLTPCSGYSNSAAGHSCGTAVDAARTGVNGWLDGSTGISLPNCITDFDAAVSNAGTPEALQVSPASYDAGDHANLSFAGYAALAGRTHTDGCPLLASSPPQ